MRPTYSAGALRPQFQTNLTYLKYLYHFIIFYIYLSTIIYIWHLVLFVYTHLGLCSFGPVISSSHLIPKGAFQHHVIRKQRCAATSCCQEICWEQPQDSRLGPLDKPHITHPLKGPGGLQSCRPKISILTLIILLMTVTFFLILFGKKIQLIIFECHLCLKVIQGSLEVKLPTIWTDEKQRWEESEKRREEKNKEDQKRGSLRRKKIQVREKVGKSESRETQRFSNDLWLRVVKK